MVSQDNSPISPISQIYISEDKVKILVTAPFNNMRTLKFKPQPTNAFFAIVKQMFGGSSQPPNTAERAVIKLLCRVQTTKQCSAVVVSWEKLPNIWLTAAKNAFVGRLLNFRVRMLLLLLLSLASRHSYVECIFKNISIRNPRFRVNLELICTSEFFKKLKLHEPLQRVQFRVLKNSQVQINSKLNEKNYMVTY